MSETHEPTVFGQLGLRFGVWCSCGTFTSYRHLTRDGAFAAHREHVAEAHRGVPEHQDERLFCEP